MARSRVRPRGPSFADPEDVADWAADLPDSFLACRENHNWKPLDVDWLDFHGEPCGPTRAHSIGRVRRCTRCKTRRVQTLDLRGAIVRSHYEYPEGYQSEGLGRIVGDGRNLLRLESVTRDLSKKRTPNGDS